MNILIQNNGWYNEINIIIDVVQKGFNRHSFTSLKTLKIHLAWFIVEALLAKVLHKKKT